MVRRTQTSRTRRGKAVVGACALAVLALAGCGGKSDGIDFGDGVGSAPTSSAATPSTDPTAAAEQAVLAGYAAYWKVGEQLSGDPSADRAAVTSELSGVAVDPLLTSVVDQTVGSALAGQRAYGDYVRHPKTPVFQDEDDTEAIVTDCIDSSQAGMEEVATGKKLTVGSAANYTESTLVKGTDGVWRVSKIVADERTACTA